MDTQRGLSVTTNSVQVIESINHFHDQILSSGSRAHWILDAVEHNPDNLLLHTYAAVFYLYGQTHPATAMAKEHLFQAEQLVRSANLREKIMHQAAKAWMNLDYESALTSLTSVTELYPRDTLAAKFAEWLFYCAGQAYNGHNYLALCQGIAKHNQDESHFLAMHSFALELSGHISEAQQMAEQAVLMEPVTPWAHHCLGHIYLNTNNIAGGIAVLGSFQDSWEGILPLLQGHNNWHLALFYLALRQEDKVMALYPAVFGALPDTICQQIDAISLLWRLDMAGLPQSNPFPILANYLDHYPLEHYTGFNTLHYVYCLARLGKESEVQKAIASIEAYAQSLAKGYSQNLWLTVVLPFSKAIHAFVTNDFQSTYHWMAPCIARGTEMGGSDAQSELFAQVYLICLVQLNKKKAAQEFFNFHLAHYKRTPLAKFWFDLS